MAKLSFEPGDWFQTEQMKFAQASLATIPICKEALYEGAKVCADAVKVSAGRFGSLANGVDLSKMATSSDGADIVLGFGGFDSKGTPYKLIANVMESGNSNGAPATHFFSSTMARTKGAATSAMESFFWGQMNKILEK